MIRLLFLSFVALACFGAPPDLTGVWCLDVEKSQFDRQAPPRMAVGRIEYKEPILVMHSTRAYGEGPESSGTVHYRIGGKGENEIMGSRMRYEARWDGATLEIVTKGSF